MSQKKKPCSRKKTGKKAGAEQAGKADAGKGSGRVHFITGYPSFTAKRLVERLSELQPDSEIFLLVQKKFNQEASEFISSLDDAEKRAPVSTLVGDIIHMDLGLSGEEFCMLTDRVTDVFHLAAIHYLGVRRDHAEQVNIEGTRLMLQAAREMKQLRRFNHMSTAFVCGDRTGVIAEDELEEGQRFRNFFEETKYEAELIVQEVANSLPITVLRPGIIVGDSRTGEIDRFHGPYYLGILLVTSPLGASIPLPGDCVAPLNVVPADFVVDAMLTLNEDKRAEGRTFHLVDPNPMSSRRVYQLIAEKAGKQLPKGSLSYRITDRLLHLPGIDRLMGQQRQAVEYVNHLAIFNSHNTLELLDGTGVRCPPLESYLDRLMDYVKTRYRQRHGRLSMMEDELD